ncbi:MAG: chemotaxis protein CheX [Butyribacter sp.]|nr:chemotaxis protein CheX [Butyribacter sp.]
MTGREICDVFDRAFGEVTEKLVHIALKKTGDNGDEDTADILLDGYRETIQTKGYINAEIVCHFSEDLFWYIVDTMNGGSTPPKEEIPLYLNEYINIICGHALSNLNNMLNKPSRLSVPSFYKEQEPITVMCDLEQAEYLSYHSKAGVLQVYICYAFESDQKEGK